MLYNGVSGNSDVTVFKIQRVRVEFNGPPWGLCSEEQIPFSVNAAHYHIILISFHLPTPLDDSARSWRALRLP